MTKVDDSGRMRHMREAAQKAVDFSHGKTRADLETDEILCLALVRLLEIVGEAAAGISSGTRSQISQIPWSKIVGMRNRLVHGYDQIDLDILLQTLTQDLGGLIGQLDQQLGDG